ALANWSARCSRTQSSLAACVAALSTTPVRARNSAASPSFSASDRARWSDQTIPGPSGLRASSTSTKDSRAAAKPMAHTAAYASGAAARTCAHASTTEDHQRDGSCSAHPASGCAVATGTRVSAASRQPDHSAAFVALVPRSRVRTVPSLTGTSDAGETPNDLAERREVLSAPTGLTRRAQELAHDARREQWALLLRRVRDGEIEVLCHQVGHEPRLPVVGCRTVGEDALERDARPNRGAVPRRVSDHLVQLLKVDARLRGHCRRLGGGEHLRGVDEVVAELDDLAHAGAADVDDEPGERLQRGAGGVEHVGLAARHEREGALLGTDRAAGERRLEVAGTGHRHPLVQGALHPGVDGRRVDDDLAGADRRPGGVDHLYDIG